MVHWKTTVGESNNTTTTTTTVLQYTTTIQCLDISATSWCIIKEWIYDSEFERGKTHRLQYRSTSSEVGKHEDTI